MIMLEDLNSCREPQPSCGDCWSFPTLLIQQYGQEEAKMALWPLNYPFWKLSVTNHMMWRLLARYLITDSTNYPEFFHSTSCTPIECIGDLSTVNILVQQAKSRGFSSSRVSSWSPIDISADRELQLPASILSGR